MKHWIYPTVWLLAALLLAACDGQNSRQAQPDNDSTAQPMAAGLFSSETHRDTRGTGNDASLSAIVPADAAICPSSGCSAWPTSTRSTPRHCKPTGSPGG
jgi:hypothetical protein